MARSDYVYVLTHPRQSYPLATCTVKREMRDVLIKVLTAHPDYRHALSLYRFDDGPDGRKAEMDIQSVIDEKPGRNVRATPRAQLAER